MSKNIFDLSGMQVKKDESTVSRSYKPSLKDASGDGIYRATLRFVPNIDDPSKSIIDTVNFYLMDPHNPQELKTVVSILPEQERNFPLRNLYWKLKRGTASEQRMAECIQRKEAKYALVQIIKDAQKPELEGKIVPFQFGKKVKGIIEEEFTPVDESIEPCNVFDFIKGKNFALIIKKKDGYPNYDSCRFLNPSPIVIDGKPMEETAECGEIIGKYLEGTPEMLMACMPREWSDETKRMVDELMDIYAGNDTNVHAAATEAAHVSVGEMTAIKNDEPEMPAPVTAHTTAGDDLFSDIDI